MNIFIFANCQGFIMKDLIPSTYKVDVRHNYYYITKDVIDDDIFNLLHTCDYFIYQPLSSIYPVYNTDNLKLHLKTTCKCISFPYIYNDAFTPLYKSIKRDIAINGEYDMNNVDSYVYGNSESIIELKKSMSLDKIIEYYRSNKIDFRYKERFEKTINILIEKEKDTDVKVSQFIIDNYKKCNLFKYHNSTHDIVCCNHPSNTLIMYYVNEIFKIIGIDPIDLPKNELIGGVMYVSRYDIEYYKYDWIHEESENIDKYIEKLIVEIYNS